MIKNRGQIARTPTREVATKCIEAGIERSHPDTVLRDKLNLKSEKFQVKDDFYDLSSYDSVYVIGGGNFAGHVAAALENLLGEYLTEGIVVTDDSVETETIDVIEGDYPVPSERCMAGAQQVLNIATKADEQSLIITVLSGGGSQLLSAPVADITLSDLQDITDLLFSHGVSDKELNVVRKHLSSIKGGKLARAAEPAEVLSLVFSDVVGNEIGAVASGPTAPDDSTFSDAIDVLDRYEIDAPKRISQHLERGRNGSVPETPTEGASLFEKVKHQILADGMTALEGVRDEAKSLGYNSLLLSSRYRGSAREAAKTFVAIGEECNASGIPCEPPVVIIAGGQTTVQSPENDQLGPNQEFALSGAIEFRKSLPTGTALASISTEGFDGFDDAAGAVVDTRTAYPMSEAWEALESSNASEFLAERGDRVYANPTGTNVNDIYVLVIDSN